MTAARLEKLKSLLSRVQERRTQPRLSAVAPVPKAQEAEAAALLESAEVPTAAHDISPVLRPEPVEKPLQAGREDAQRVAHAPTLVGNMPPVQVAVPPVPPAVAKAPEPPAPPAVHKPVEPPAPPALEKPVEPPAPPAVAKAVEPSPPQVAPAEAKAPVSERELPAVEPAAEVARVEEAPLTGPTSRVEPSPLAASKPVVRAVSAPVVETPKTFGELLELSLSLRPRP